jgi:hypothetical protein
VGNGIVFIFESPLPFAELGAFAKVPGGFVHLWPTIGTGFAWMRLGREGSVVRYTVELVLIVGSLLFLGTAFGFERPGSGAIVGISGLLAYAAGVGVDALGARAPRVGY